MAGIAAMISKPFESRENRPLAIDRLDDDFGCERVRCGEFLEPRLIDSLIVRPFHEKHTFPWNPAQNSLDDRDRLGRSAHRLPPRHGFKSIRSSSRANHSQTLTE